MNTDRLLPLRRTIAFQLGMPIVVWIVMTLITISILAYRTHTYTIENIERVPRGAVQRGSSDIQRYFIEMRRDMAFAETYAHAPYAPEHETILIDIVHTHPAITRLDVYDRFGTLLYHITRNGTTSADTAVPVTPNTVPHEINPLSDDNAYISDPFTGTDGIEYITWTIPLFAEDTSFDGHMAVTQTADIFSETLKPMILSGVYVYLANVRGNIFTSSEIDGMTSFPSVAHLTPTDNSVMRIHTEHGIKDAPALVFAKKIPHTPWFILAEVRDDAQLPETAGHMNIIFWIGIALILFLGYELYALHTHLLSPLSSFGKTVRALGEGKYRERVSLATQNEFSLLASSINDMARKLEAHSEKHVAEMERMISDLNKSTKMLLQRDLELTRANDELRQIDKMKSDFISLATHQLRTPLSGARWALSMLINGEMGELTPEQKLYIMKTYESNNRMISLINDMLQADKVDSGTLQFSFEPTNVLRLLENTLPELQQFGERKKVRVSLVAPKILPSLSIDPSNMRAVLQNLIDNAIKYSHPDSEVSVHVSRTENFVEISVADTGIGIPPEHQKNIFKRFFRAPNAVHMETDGTGLGLYLAESIIRKHHGTIRFVSEEQKGTTFYITLPIPNNPIKHESDNTHN